MIPLHFVRGFLMGSADVVPGVSGGTVALITGIYPRLIDNVRRGAGALAAFVRLRFAEGLDRLRDIEWGFLLPLLAGIAVALSMPWTVMLLVPCLAVLYRGVISREETYLEQKFGDDYRAYKTRVRRWV